MSHHLLQQTQVIFATWVTKRETKLPPPTIVKNSTWIRPGTSWSTIPTSIQIIALVNNPNLKLHGTKYYFYLPL